MKKIISFLFCCLICGSAFVERSTAQAFEIKDTVVKRGQEFIIPVFGFVPDRALDSVQVTLQVDYRLIAPLEFITDDQTLLSNLKTIQIDKSNLLESRYDVRFAGAKSGTGILFKLKALALAGPDSITTITPLTSSGKSGFYPISANDTIQSKYGIITISGGLPVVYRITEGIGENFPNPFTWYTDFPVTVEDNSDVKISIFDGAGKEFSIPTPQLKVGTNTVRVNVSEFVGRSNGLYFFRVTTKKGSYNKPFYFLF